MIEGEDFTHRVGDLIRKARKAQGLTQAELGQLAGGKNKETINRLEAGENTRLQTLVATSPQRWVPQQTQSSQLRAPVRPA